MRPHQVTDASKTSRHGDASLRINNSILPEHSDGSEKISLFEQ